MKRISRVLGLFLCFAVVLSINVLAANAKIDVSTAADGYFTVYYEGTADLKMKVGLTFDGKTEYFNYTPGKYISYAFEKGNGSYTVALYRNVSGTTYKSVAKERVAVKLKDALAPWLVSTMEITFSEGDSVSQKAAELCQGLSNDAEKIVAIHNYIAEHFKYDFKFAADVRRGAIKNYVPDTNRALMEKTGVCYDLSAVFAAMCRSQGIPCAMEKGYTANGYHAWNLIRLDEAWVSVDLTTSVIKKAYHADKLSDCIVPVKTISAS